MNAISLPTILALIAAAGVTAWLFGAYYLANSPAMAARRGRPDPGRYDDEMDDGGGATTHAQGPTTIVGTIEIDGEPSRDSARFAAALARQGLGFVGPVEIVERRDDRLVFATAGDDRGPRGEVRITAAGHGRARFDYVIEYPALARILKAGWAIQAAGLVMLAVVYGTLRTLVLNSPNPAVRWQAVQMVQCVHLLWPPFMMGHRYRSQYRQVRRQFETTIKNLPHVPS